MREQRVELSVMYDNGMEFIMRGTEHQVNELVIPTKIGGENIKILATCSKNIGHQYTNYER